MKLQDKVAIVTGATGGIGSEITRLYVSEGARVVAADLDQQKLQALSENYPGSVLGVVTDVTDFGQVESVVNAAVDHFGTLDIMINNAGIGIPKLLLDHDPEADFEITTNVNQKGVYHGILAAGRKLRDLQKAGTILNTSSVYGRMAAEMTFTYNVSKAAVDMMTRCAALEYAPYGIRVCAVGPGRVDTPLLRQYEALGLWEHIRAEQMRDRFMSPTEIAEVFVYLASDAAECINGSTIYADDGFINFKYPLMKQG